MSNVAYQYTVSASSCNQRYPETDGFARDLPSFGQYALIGALDRARAVLLWATEAARIGRTETSTKLRRGWLTIKRGVIKRGVLGQTRVLKSSTWEY